MKKYKAWLVIMWRPILAFTAVTLVVGCILGFRLGSLIGGVSAQEQSYISSNKSFKNIVDHPIYAAHKLPTYALNKLNMSNPAYFRAVSVIFATMAVASCFFVLREWYSDRIAVLGTWLFLVSAWTLHISRLATPEASFLLLMPLLWASVWLYNTTLRKTALLLLSLLAALSFYVPGFGWLIIATAIWRRKSLWSELKQVPVWFRLLCGLVIITCLTPLVRAGVLDSSELLLASGLPAQLPTIRMLGENLLAIPTQLFAKGPLDPVRWLGRLPLLDLFSAVMLVLGIYSARFHVTLIRMQILAASSLLLAVLITSGGPMTITALIPAVYFVIAAGMAFMLQQWFVVFPRNPIARSIGTSLLSVSVLLVSFYHISHYFIAWPGAPATRASFTHTLVK